MTRAFPICLFRRQRWLLEKLWCAERAIQGHWGGLKVALSSLHRGRTGASFDIASCFSRGKPVRKRPRMTPLTILPAMGALTFLSALRPFVFAERTRIVTLNLIAATSFTIALALFPDDIGIAFDRATGVPGLGYLISRLTISLAAVVFVGTHTYAANLWDRTRKALLILPVTVAALLFVVCWALGHGLVDHAPETAYYHGYHGRPGTVFWTSVARGLIILCYSIYGVYIFGRESRTEEKGWRWVSLVLVAAFVGSVLDGLAAIASALAEFTGRPSPLLLSTTSLAVIGCCGVIMTCYLIYADVRPLVRYVRALRRANATYRALHTEHEAIKAERAALAAEHQELEKTRDQIITISTRLDDQYTQARKWVDQNFIAAAKCVCDREQLGEEDRQLFLQAARDITLNPENIHLLVNDQSLDPGEARTGALEFASLAGRGLYFYSDADLIGALAMGAEEFGVELPRNPTERHQRLGRRLGDLLRSYDHPADKLATYRKMRAASIAANDELAAALLGNEERDS